jgi:Topoisomerase 6 subunit A/Spo11, Toprim domain
VRELVAHLDGCSGAKAGEIVAAAKLGRAVCSDIPFGQAAKLLEIARANAKPVTPERLGTVGPIFDNWAYACASGVVQFGSAAPLAEIPFVVEAWADRKKGPGKTTHLIACVNRTPVTGDIYAVRDKREIDAFGCGLGHTIAQASKEAQFSIWLNITTPYMPITSDGKEPDLEPFFDEIAAAVGKAVRKAHRPDTTDRLTQKDVVLDNLDTVIAEVSGDGEFRFNERQLFYALRPIVMGETSEELKIANFKNIITDYENEHGEISGMYREPRGSIYHPHRCETITLGTLMVENYERPSWVFNKVVYIEKEGFSEALKDARWAERHDCMLMSSKGFSTRAARDLVDKLAEHDEPVTIFCVHDADASGGLIYQTFQEATKARGARKIKIVNLGLEPWEAMAMGLDVETLEAGERRKPVADYVRERDDAEDWDTWLQTHRTELNAMTTPQFIEWLDGKMVAYGKLIPPPDVLAAELDELIENKIRTSITERILREAGLEDQVAAAIAAIKIAGPID